MSRADTYRRTRDALASAGQAVHPAPMLRDVDTVADAEAVAAGLGDGHFWRAWRDLAR
jgi:glycosyltransferase A (GT-A) superfamily protein (DUF2064 family)